MKNLLKKLLQRKWLLGISGVGLLIAGFFLWGNSGDEAQMETLLVEKKDLIQEVNLTGTVQSVEEVDLSFETGGKIGAVYVDLGDTVQAGEVLASLDNGNAYSQMTRAEAGLSAAEAQLKSYQASLAAELARLDSIKVGASEEEIAVTEVAVQNAEIALADAQNNSSVVSAKAEVDLANLIDDIPDLIYEAYAVADEAVRIETDALFENERTDSNLTFQVTEFQIESDVERLRDKVENELLDWQADLSSLPTSSEELQAEFDLGIGHLELIRTFLMDAMDALNYSAGLSAATLATYMDSVNSARSSVNAEIEAIVAQKQAISAQIATNDSAINTATTQVNSAQNALNSAKAELDLQKAGATDEAIRIQEAAIAGAEANLEIQAARIAEAEANYSYYAALYEQTLITAPFSGILTMQEAKAGAVTSATTPMIGLLSEREFEIEAMVAEADIAKLEVGLPAEVTLDAYGSDQTFEATVIFISRGETVIDGVSTYLVKLQFKEDSELVKSGMTANIDIMGENRTQVIAIPQRAIIRRDGTKYVQVLKNGIVEEVEVTTGLRSSDGSIEILSGLREGDEVVLYSE